MTPTSPDTPIRADLARLLAGLWPALADPPAAVVRRAQRLWLDTVSCAAAGLSADEPRRWLDEAARGDAGAVPLPAAGRCVSPPSAAMALALGACWDEACEGLAIAHGRPGVPVVAALWAALPARPASWLDLWRATVAGYEVAGRLGARLRMKPGLHVDGTWGAFGAAVASVHLAGGTWQQALDAVETAATQLPLSLLRPVHQGANVRNLYLGHSAWLGLQAAQAVHAGMRSPVGAVDDFAALALDGSATGSWPDPGRWLILDSYWKPFAAVRHVHYGAQAALVLRAQGLAVDRIDDIRLRIYAEALQYCANRAPATPLGAQFSLSFGVAAALAFGDLSPAEFRAPRFDDPLLRRLEAMVRIEADPGAFPDGQRGAVLEVRAEGRSVLHRQGAITGDPGHDPDEAAVQAKFDRYSRRDAALAAWARRMLHDDPRAAACLPT